MKGISLLLISIVTVVAGQAQSEPEEYKAYQVQNASGRIIQSVNKELATNAQTQSGFNQLVRSRRENTLQNQNQIQAHLNSFNKALTDLNKRNETRQNWYKVGTELGKYGVSVFANYADMGPSILTKWLTPALEQGAGLLADEIMKDVTEKGSQQMDQLIKNQFNLLRSNGIDPTTDRNEQEFAAVFALANHDLSGLPAENRSIFNKELIKSAYKYLDKNRNEIKKLEQRLNQTAAGDRAQLQAQIDEIKNTIQGKDLRNTTEFARFKNEITVQIKTQQETFTRELNKELDKYGRSISNLIEGQKQVFNTLDNIENRIKANLERIKALESDMDRVNKDIKDLKGNVSQLKARVTDLEAIQRLHGDLIAKNAFQIDILSGYAFQNLNTKQKIEVLDRGDFDNIFQGKEKEDLKAELNKIRETETFISVAANTASYASAVYELGVNAGLLKGNDAKVAGRLVNDLTNAANLTTGIARVYCGDVSGVISIMSGLSGFAKRGSTPAESPEMQMLKHMFKVMNERFNRIDSSLYKIESKIDRLSGNLSEMYRSMMTSFQFMSDEFERINKKIDNLTSLTKTQIFENYHFCAEVDSIRLKLKVDFNEYSDYRKFYSSTTRDCLQGLYKMIYTSQYRDYFFMSASPQLEADEYIAYEMNQVYDSTKKLFLSFYDRNRDKATLALMFPVMVPEQANKPLVIADTMSNVKHTSLHPELNTYYNYEMITQFSDLFMTFSGYFEIHGSNSGFEPPALGEYMVATEINERNRVELERSYNWLLNLTEYSIMQQSMISGNLMLDPIYATLFQRNPDQNKIRLAMNVLKYNKVLAKNFATYLINKNMKLAQAGVQELFKKIKTDSSKLGELNNKIQYDDFKFSVNDGKLYLTIKRNAESVSILCPELFHLLMNKMVNTESLNKLLETRRCLFSSLVDLSFTKSAGEAGVDIESLKYNFIELVEE